MNFTKTILTISIASAISISANASLKNELQKSFINDSEFKIGLINRSQDSKGISTNQYDNYDEPVSQYAIHGGYQSGYLYDSLGFDVDHYAVYSIDGGLHGFSQTAASLKAKIGESSHIRYGTFISSLPLMNNKVEMITPALTKAVLFNTKLNKTDFYFMNASENQAELRAGFDTDENPESPESVNIIGLSHQAGNGFTTDLSIGHQSDRMAKLYADITSPEINLYKGQISLNAKGVYTDSDGSLYREFSDNNETTSAGWYSAKLNYSQNNLNLFATTQNIQSSNGISADQSWFGDNYLSFVGHNNALISDFNSSDMRSWSTGVQYNMSDLLNGLTTKAVYLKGNSNESQEREYNLAVNYSHPSLPVSASLEHGNNKLSENGDLTETKDTIFKLNFAVNF